MMPDDGTKPGYWKCWWIIFKGIAIPIRPSEWRWIRDQFVEAASLLLNVIMTPVVRLLILATFPVSVTLLALDVKRQHKKQEQEAKDKIARMKKSIWGDGNEPT